jgi:hypothetical protein
VQFIVGHINKSVRVRRSECAKGWDGSPRFRSLVSISLLLKGDGVSLSGRNTGRAGWRGRYLERVMIFGVGLFGD